MIDHAGGDAGAGGSCQLFESIMGAAGAGAVYNHRCLYSSQLNVIWFNTLYELTMNF